MEKHEITTRTYVIVCVGLILLTFATIGVSTLGIPGRWHIILGLIIALCKGSLVVLFFMHAIISPRVTWMVIIVAGFWLFLFLSLTLTDYSTRDLVPFMWGH
jgi:caa(3)-type oxidase subunit IV